MEEQFARMTEFYDALGALLARARNLDRDEVIAELENQITVLEDEGREPEDKD